MRKAAWAIVGPAVRVELRRDGPSAWRRRPGAAPASSWWWFGFAWFLSALHFSDSPVLYSIAFVMSGLWGGVFLHLVMAFPSGRLRPRIDRSLVIAGYLMFTVASVPVMLFAGPHEVGCDMCPANVLLIRATPTSPRSRSRARRCCTRLFVASPSALSESATPPLERLQLTPVYAAALLAFLLVTAGTAGAADEDNPLWWAAFAVTAALPAAFLAGLLRSRIARLDAELRARLEEFRASRARLVEASDTERRRLERNLHDGAQARFVGLALVLGHARRRVDTDPTDPEVGELLDRANERAQARAGRASRARARHPPGAADRAGGWSRRCARSPPWRRCR